MMNSLKHYWSSLLVLQVLTIGQIENKNAFNSETLKCLVCQAMVKEFAFAIKQVDPNKKIEVGGFRLKADGTNDRKVVPYLRSVAHLDEIIETLCEQFEDYAQAQTKDTGRPTLIRITNREGGMNPNFGAVDIVPDEDLNTRLKFYCESVLEEHEEHFHDVMAQPQSDLEPVMQTICHQRTQLCGRQRVRPSQTHREL